MKKTFFILLGFFFLLPSISSALTISTIAVGNDFPARSDSDTASGGFINSTAKIYPDENQNDLMASASASENGSLAASTYCLNWDFFDEFASASWSNTFMNTSSTLTSYSFDFYVENILLSTGVSDGFFDCYDNFSSSYSINVTLDGSLIWNSSVEITGNRSGTFFNHTGTDLGGVFLDDSVVVDDYEGCHGGGSYAIDSYSETIFLGDFNPGDSYTLEYEIIVGARGCEHGFGYAKFGDPLNSSTPGLYGSVLSTVPEPATMLLLGPGFAFILGIGRFRKK